MKPFIIKTTIYPDNRGFFKELFLKKKIKFNCKFTAMSCSKKNVIRGLHYQDKKKQSKILSVLKGRAIDICVNIDKKSKNFGKIYKFDLKPGLLLYVPNNYAHGIGFLGKENILLYHLSEYRYPEHERGLAYNDKYLKINWKIKKPILSIRDKKHPSFKDLFKRNNS
ncbi:dTDP-4-dehydrorhamnose 3,5-epimerase family protein [Candidatus Pelagibacter sp. Uisw_130]|uniref:dTDP-4-dehydrorhamnose 3,5-epimerase family protein n=1 Tax=Candidatus Pelagibacter sp. Uisw_130 TaxID=3230989 RepID=UPI0039EB9427